MSRKIQILALMILSLIILTLSFINLNDSENNNNNVFRIQGKKKCEFFFSVCKLIFTFL
jgi:hypothetical protein